MQEAIERLNREALLRIIGRDKPDVSTVDALIKRFEAELSVQEGNITEPGEKKATESLREQWQDFLQKFQEFQGLSRPRCGRKLLLRPTGAGAGRRSIDRQ